MAETIDILKNTNGHEETPGIMVLKFADSKIPKEKTQNNKAYILFGEANDYPEYLLYQYNKCGRHRAIVNSKVKYIIGSGLTGQGGFEESDGGTSKKVNSAGET